MTDNERILEPRKIDWKQLATEYGDGFIAATKTVQELQSALEQRDKTIAELSGIYETQYGAYNQFLQQQNALMLSALKQISEYKNFNANTCVETMSPEAHIANLAIAKVKAITNGA